MFPDLTAEQVHEATAARWDVSGPIPVPRPGWMACPVCRSRRVQARYWRFFKQGGATVPGRCDVSVKCTACAAAWMHGVALDESTYARMTAGPRPESRRIRWREARRLLTGET